MPKRTCTIAECDKPAVGRGWCRKHYTRWQRWGDPLGFAPKRPPQPPKPKVHVPCSVEGCDARTIGRGWCSTHYARWFRHGTVADPEPKESALEYIQRHLRSLESGCMTDWPYGRCGRQRRPCINYLGRNMTAVRCAWHLLHGTMPQDQLNHVCNNSDCWNPLHVYDGDQQANMLDLAHAGNHSNRKLTDQQVREIRHLARQGVKQSVIAEEYGIARTYVSRISSGVRRGAVP
jgi:hypothetical protein